MRHRISAGGVVVYQNKVLLVHHYREGEFDFWVLPGGGVEGNEGFIKAAEREVYEETNLAVQAEKIAYLEDLIDEGRYVCKFWVYCQLVSGELDFRNRRLDETFLVDAGFFSEGQIQSKNVHPAILKDQFWKDLANGFQEIKYLGNTL
jgi:ADP-ribose pyrophosphatase YjhB (NUDIX family)